MGPTTSAGALQQLQQYQQSAKTPDQAFTEANQQFGVPAAQQTLTGLRGALQQTTNLLGNVAPSVMGRTQNSLVTDAQSNRIIGNEQQPIQQNLSKLGTSYGNAQEDFQTASGQANQRAQATLTGQQGQLSYLQNLYNSLVSQEQQAAQLAEQQRQFNLTPRGGSGGGAGGSAGLSLGGASAPGQAADPVRAATAFAQLAKQKLLSQGNVQPFAREGVRDQLVGQFGLSAGQANDIVYKQLFPDNWAGGGSAPALQAINKGIGKSGGW